MKKILSLCICIITAFCSIAQNVGIGIPTPLTKLHIFNGSSGATPFSFSPLAVESNGHTYINLLSPAANETAILFGQPGSSANGGILYNNSSTPNGFQFRNNGNQTRMIINNFGNIGIGTLNPQAQLDVVGSIKTLSAKTNSLTIATGGLQSDFLVKSNSNGDVGFRKGYNGLGLNYIIRIQGAFPTQGSGPNDIAFLGEIKLFAGNYAPNNWALCNGQSLPVNTANQGLFSLIGTTYGGDGVTTFALPDLRDAVPVGPGTNWQLGERSN